MGNYTTTEIEQKVKGFTRWYQNINLAGIQTCPENNGAEKKWKFLEPHVPKDLKGKTVLDLACNAGFFSTKMYERGAKVLGIDFYSEAIDQAKFVADVLDMDIDFRVENIYEFLLNNKQEFDYVLFLGLFYHLRYPLLVLDQVANITNEKLYFQTVIRTTENDAELNIPENIKPTEHKIFSEPNFPKLFFIEKNYADSYDNWFLCNLRGVYAILQSAGFRNIKKSGSNCFICNPPIKKQTWMFDLFSLK